MPSLRRECPYPGGYFNTALIACPVEVPAERTIAVDVAVDVCRVELEGWCGIVV